MSVAVDSKNAVEMVVILLFMGVLYCFIRLRSMVLMLSGALRVRMVADFRNTCISCIFVVKLSDWNYCYKIYGTGLGIKRPTPDWKGRRRRFRPEGGMEAQAETLKSGDRGDVDSRFQPVVVCVHEVPSV